MKFLSSILKSILSISNLQSAGIFLFFASIWMISGFFVEKEIPTKQVVIEETTVRVMKQSAQPFARNIILKGSAEADKNVQLRAETSGQVIGLPVAQGQFVKKGSPICQIFVGDKDEVAKEASLNYETAKKLFDEGLYSNSQLQSAKARYERAFQDLDFASVKAPFDGIVDRIDLDVGDFLPRQGVCATVLDLNPILISAEVSENDMSEISLGSSAKVELNNGKVFEGNVKFISSSANPVTRTFRVEISVPNPESEIKDGMTSEVTLKGTERLAHLVPVSVLRLDSNGDLGIRTIDGDGLVAFRSIELIEDTSRGAWISGLDTISTIITVGQDYVSQGEKVSIALDSRFTDSNERIN
ncbi:efflux RND transporter periplasmic adaptor subunit [SAR86 cluster bacterium]|nr:efflux RND transporter periplasmic adaptor subunit [SAR86 cluster bacterium]